MSDPKDKIIKIQGQDYLQVKDRVTWWRDENPDAIVATEILLLDIEREYAAVKASVTLPSGAHADGMGSASKAGLTAKRAKVPPDQFLEMAETRAVGRALGRLGYGTGDVGDDDQPVDTPNAATASNGQQAPRQQQQRPAPAQSVTPAASAPAPAQGSIKQQLERLLVSGSVAYELTKAATGKTLAQLTPADQQAFCEVLADIPDYEAALKYIAERKPKPAAPQMVG